ncbi:MAG: hypothetical protein ACI97K_002529 [Glaciecola sp.]|jgi:hypothetical protein
MIPKITLNELPNNANMNMDLTLQIIYKLREHFIPMNKPLPLSQIMPPATWQPLNQGQKGYVGQVFYDLCNELGFEYAGKDMTGTTNLYRLFEHVDL